MERDEFDTEVIAVGHFSNGSEADVSKINKKKFHAIGFFYETNSKF